MTKYYDLDSGTAETDLDLDYEDRLNPQQLEVVRAGGGPKLVIAGAGSGKTHTLTHRVARLVEEGVPPDHILLLTFTNKAARSMTDRVSTLLGIGVEDIWSGTFHGIGNRFLRREADRLGWETDYTILDVEDTKTLVQNCRGEADVDTTDQNFPKAKVLGNIHSYCINTQSTIEEVLAERYDHFTHRAEDVRRVFRLYQSRKVEMNVMDFDDLLLNWKHLLRDHEDVREQYTGHFEHILVDEYHDTNHVQSEIVDMLASAHGNLTVVGDDCQSIYAFRGADYRNILEFPDRYENCRTFKLETNYRSTPEILELANTSIRHNDEQFQKTLRADREPGMMPAFVTLEDREQQAEFVCTRILELVDEGWDFEDVAVLYRSHHHSMELQVEMTKRNIPYVVRSGLRFFEKAHIKDVLAHLKFVFNPRDELSFMRVAELGHGIGPKRADDIWMYLNSQTDPLRALRDERLRQSLPGRAESAWEKLSRRLALVRDGRMEPPGELIEAVLEHGYDDYVRHSFDNADDRIEDLRQLADYAQQFPDLDRFLGEIALLTDVSGEGVQVGDDDRDDFVCLSSVHQAKGLEWPAVFVLSLSEGDFPHHRSTGSTEEIEEERRLFYVATTRARDELYLCHPTKGSSRRGNRMEIKRPSMFLREIREDPTLDELPWETWRIRA